MDEGYVHIAPKSLSKGIAENFCEVCVDRFLEDPDMVRNFGLSVPKLPAPGGKWPGIRSDSLNTIDDDHGKFVNEILLKALGCYFDLSFQNISWKRATMAFHEIPKLDEDKHSVKNMGWIHNDLNSQINWQLAGIIYLTPDADPDTGTSLYDLREDKASTTETQIRIVNSQPEKCAFYLDQKYDEVEYKETLEKHLESFTEKTIFQNIYNRLIMYDSNEFHRANNFHSDGENRLTLVFFVSDIEIAKTPLKRIREYNDFDADIKDIIGKIKKREWLNKK